MSKILYTIWGYKEASGLWTIQFSNQCYSASYIWILWLVDSLNTNLSTNLGARLSYRWLIPLKTFSLKAIKEN